MMSRWQQRSDVPRGDDYDARWKALAASGLSIHGEADCVMQFTPNTVLDAGCGTGRVGIELARRGVDVVGVDLDPGMLATAQAKASGIEWHLGNLASWSSAQRFDVVVMAGNVMIFVEPGTESAVIANMAAHLAPGGRLIAGFQLGPSHLALADYDRHCADATLVLESRSSTWDGKPFGPADSYAVSVHRLVS